MSQGYESPVAESTLATPDQGDPRDIPQEPTAAHPRIDKR